MMGEVEASLEFLTENSIDIICRARMDMVLFYVSPSSFHVLGWLPAEMIGQRPDAFFSPEDSSPGAGMVHSSPATVRMRMKNGQLAWVEIRYRVVCDSSTGEPREIVIVIRDVTERKSLAEKLSELQVNDTQISLSTTRGLEQALNREWSRMLREGSHLSLLLLDFNGFRRFHPGSSHLEGDQCLAEVTAAIHGVLRLTDAAVHYRAEQIAILLSATGAYGAATVAAKVRIAIQSLRPSRGDQTHSREDRDTAAVHIGMATTRPRSAATNRMPELLLLAAETALQRAIAGDTLVSTDTF